MKVLTLVGTRPELVKLSRVLAELERHTEHVLVHSGQNYDVGLNEIFFEELCITRPVHFLNAVGSSTAETIGLIISKFDIVLEQEQPEAVLLYGDTNTTLGVIAAKRRKIPVFHMEAGNRSFDQRVPEEINRKIVDHLSDVNMTNSEHARRYLLSEGCRPELVVKTGSPMKEVLTYFRPNINASAVLDHLGLAAGGYVLVSVHREETVDVPERLGSVLETLIALADRFGLPVVVSTHPRTRERLSAMGVATEEGAYHPEIRFLPPFGLFDYVKLELGAFCVVSDSGTLTEEASLLGFPAVTIREAHERPEGVDRGVIVLCGIQSTRVLQAVEVVTSQATGSQPLLDDYDVEDVSRVVVRTILSYVDYINRVVWQRS